MEGFSVDFGPPVSAEVRGHLTVDQFAELFIIDGKFAVLIAVLYLGQNGFLIER